MTEIERTDDAPRKENVRESISEDRGAIRKYQDFFVGNREAWALIQYELAQLLAVPVPGAVGYVLRKWLMTPLLKNAGDGVQLGRNIVVRHPGQVSIGTKTAVDDHCVLDARGVEEGDIRIGENVLVARGTVMTSKTDQGSIEIGDHTTIGKNCILSSCGGIRIGKWVGIGGNCYLGGGRYGIERRDIPMMKQDLYTEGPVEIGDDCWIGAGATILDGVSIGQGSVIGAGAIVRTNVPEYTMVAPHQRLVRMPRAGGETDPSETAPGQHEPHDAPVEPKRKTAQARRKAVRTSVYRAIDTVNQTLLASKRIEKAPETPLARLDSIDKVNLIVETETEIKKELGQSVNIADDIGGEEPDDPDRTLFETVASFTEYVESQLHS